MMHPQEKFETKTVGKEEIFLNEVLGGRACFQTELNMKGIREPNEQDVLCGRGGAILRHPGNQRYRFLIKSNKPLYLISMKEEKTAISRSIIAIIRKGRGRFLERAKDKTWYDIGDMKATEKTSQAIREGQSKLRKKMIDSRLIKDNLKCNLPGSSGIMISSLATCTKHMFTNPYIGNVFDMSPNHVHTMNNQSSMLHRSFDSLTMSENETVRPDHPHRHCHHHEEINRAQIVDNLAIPGGRTFNHPRHRNSSTITPPFNRRRTVQLNQQSDDFPPLLPFGCHNDKGKDIEKDRLIVDNVGDNIDDSFHSIMTFEMEGDELSDDNDSAEMLSSSVPSSPVTNHLRALNEWNNSEPTKLEKKFVVSLRDDNDSYHSLQQQQQQEHCHFDRHSDYHHFRRNTSCENLEHIDNDGDDSSCISFGSLPSMFRTEANSHDIRHTI